VQLARQTNDAFENAQAAAVIVNAAGCGLKVKEYGHLVRDDPQYAGRAKAFAAKCRNVSEFLAELEPRATCHALRLRVAYPRCLALAARAGRPHAPRALLERLPQFQLLEIPEAATKLGDRKAGHVARAGRGHGGVRQPRLPAAAPVCPPARGAKIAGSPHHRAARRVYPRAFPCDGGALPALLRSLLRF
jgi:hypothetical protein